MDNTGNRETLLTKFFEAGLADGLATVISSNGTADTSSSEDQQLRETVELFSKDCEASPRGDNLASFDDIIEAFSMGDIDTLYEYAQKLRLALTELDAKVLNHLRNIIAVGFEVQRRSNNDSSLPAAPFLSGVRPQDQPRVLQYILQTETVSTGLHVLEFDTDYAPNTSNITQRAD